MSYKNKFYLGTKLNLQKGKLTYTGGGFLGRLGSTMSTDPHRGEIECREGSRDQRCIQGWPLDSPHVCHGIRHAGCPTLYSLASLRLSEFKPKVHRAGDWGKLMEGVSRKQV